MSEKIIKQFEKDIQMHVLNSKELQSCCVELTKVLLFGNYWTVIGNEQLWFWAWIGEVLNHRNITYTNNTNEFPIKELFNTCIRASLAGIEKPVSSSSEHLQRMNYKNNHPIENNLAQLLYNSHLILAYLSFPLLEGVLKKYCNEYVNQSGEVIKEFKVTKTDKNDKKYIREYEKNKFVSSIEDLLLLVIQKVGSNELVDNLNGILEHVKELDKENPDPCRIIYNWRNSILHGETSYPTIGGTILNMSILIFLHSIKNEYDQNLPIINKDAEWSANRKIQTSWTFYPPYL